MTTRRITKGVIAAVAERKRPKVDTFGRLRAGDDFKTNVPGRKTRVTVRFVNADADGSAVTVKHDGKLRTLHADSIEMPSQRMLNAQRQRRALERAQ